MKIKIEKKYLILPTFSTAKNKRLSFFDNGNEIYYLNINLDMISPDFYAYIDMSRFIGRELEIKVSPFMEFTYEQSDEMDGEYNDPLRPYIHFTTKRGWSNDPNGLVKYGDEYHLFYQYNPSSRSWTNMHWGHAVSKDLFHWTELDVALFPDENGTMYSGCGIIDERNLLGLQEGQKTALLYYTAAGSYAPIPKPYTQRIAYSIDGLKTIKKNDGEPALDHVAEDNRDPKVVWCEELNAYVMSLYLYDDIFGLFVSKDLQHFEELQRISIPSDGQCPNFFPIQASDGKRKWICVGAHEFYIVGSFVDGKFVVEQEEKSLSKESYAYAPQVFTDTNDGRTIRIAWGRWLGMKAKTFSQQMSLPCDVLLENINGEYYMALKPVDELQSIVVRNENYKRLSLSQKEVKAFSLNKAATGIKMKGQYLENNVLRLSCFGVCCVLDFSKNEITLGKVVNPISLNRDNFEVDIYYDRSSVEFFCDGGKIAFMLCENAVSDENLPTLELQSDVDYVLDKLEIEQYECTWENK